MEIERGRDPRACVLHLHGDIDIVSVPDIKAHAQRLTLGGVKDLILDLDDVVYLDSAALGLIVWLDRLLAPLEGKLVLAGATRNVSRILELSGLVGIAPTISAVSDAREALDALDMPACPDVPEWSQSMSVAADLAQLGSLRSRVCELLATTGMTDATLFDVRVAVGEAIANAMRHGSPEGSDDQVLVDVEAYSDRVAVVVTDSGEGFNGNPDQGEDLYASSGRGVMFMRSLMDRVEFEPHADGGTSVTLIKHVQPSD